MKFHFNEKYFNQPEKTTNGKNFNKRRKYQLNGKYFNKLKKRSKTSKPDGAKLPTNQLNRTRCA